MKSTILVISILLFKKPTWPTKHASVLPGEQFHPQFSMYLCSHFLPAILIGSHVDGTNLLFYLQILFHVNSTLFSELFLQLRFWSWVSIKGFHIVLVTANFNTKTIFSCLYSHLHSSKGVFQSARVAIIKHQRHV